jgi:hypothetical protein
VKFVTFSEFPSYPLRNRKGRQTQNLLLATRCNSAVEPPVSGTSFTARTARTVAMFKAHHVEDIGSDLARDTDCLHGCDGTQAQARL